jgi:hypothetical protein
VLINNLLKMIHISKKKGEESHKTLTPPNFFTKNS